jgi:hypothetical protein
VARLLLRSGGLGALRENSMGGGKTSSNTNIAPCLPSANEGNEGDEGDEGDAVVPGASGLTVDGAGAPCARPASRGGIGIASPPRERAGSVAPTRRVGLLSCSSGRQTG